MKVIESNDNLLVFNSGLKIEGDHNHDCCEYNYLDFEQLPVGTELQDMNAEEFSHAITIEDDGFTIRDKEGTPKWVQARSSQNGYYGYGVNMTITLGDKTITPKRDGQESWEELFSGKGDED